MDIREWALLALGVWTILFLTGLGMKFSQAILEWAKK